MNPAPASSTAQSKESQTKPTKILFVDDERSILNALKRLFRSEKSYECFFAESPAEAIKIIKDEPIAVVISDHRMPQMEGAEFLARLKEKRPSIVCMMLTGQANLNDVQKAVNSGDIYRFVLKPWNDDELKQLVASAIEKYRADTSNRIAISTATEKQQVLEEANSELSRTVQERTESLKDALKTARTLIDQLNGTLKDSARAFFSILEVARPDIGLHSRRVAKVVKRLADLAGIEPRHRYDLEMAALLHDIGTIGLPTFLLEKNRETYNSHERQLYETHPAVGADRFSKVAGFEEISKLILNHHERYNGSGFPSRLRGNEIPLGAYLIGIADEYDRRIEVITIDPVLNLQKTEQEILEMADSLFPKYVVDWILQIMEEDRKKVGEHATKKVGTNDLSPGMVIDQNVYTMGGTFVISEGTKLDHSKISRIRSIARVDPIVRDIYVRVENNLAGTRKK